MLQEYAVDPVLMGSWERFKFLTSHFGIQTGRLISRYPSHWKKLVYEAMTAAEGRGELRPVERTKIVEKLKGIDTKLAPRNPQWKDAMSWISNAIEEDGRDPFCAILSNDNSSGHAKVLTYDELDEVPPLWRAEHERVTPRTPEAFAIAIAPLVKISKNLIFIDPYFDPNSGDVLRTIRVILNRCVGARYGKPFESIEFHTLFKGEIVNFRAQCQARLPRQIPRGLSMRVVRWQVRKDGDGIHNRHVLTDRGGIRFPWGLKVGDEQETDDLILMAESTYRHRWDQFLGANPAFDLADEDTYVGVGP